MADSLPDTPPPVAPDQSPRRPPIIAMLIVASLALGAVGTTAGMFRAQQAAETAKRAADEATFTAVDAQKRASEAEARFAQVTTEKQNSDRLFGLALAGNSAVVDALGLYWKEPNQVRDQVAKWLEPHFQSMAGELDRVSKSEMIDAERANGLTNYVENLAELFSISGRSADSERLFSLVMNLRERLHREHAEKVEYRLSLARAYLNLGKRTWDSKRDIGAAVPHFERAIRIFETLANGSPPDSLAQKSLTMAHRGLAELLMELRRYPEAIRQWDAAIQAGPSLRHLFRQRRAIALAYSGDHRTAINEIDDVAKSHPAAAYNQAAVYSLASAAVANDEDFPPMERKRFREQYAAHAVKLLSDPSVRKSATRDMIAADGTFDPVRNRDDFKKMLATLP